MSGKARRVPPHAAFCEEYDEDAHAVRPETRQVANLSTKRSKNDLKVSEHTVDGASDSGYSSRTAATVNSGQFPPSGRKSPVTLRLDSTTTKVAGTERRRESRKDKGKEREDRPPAGEATTMQVEPLRNSSRLGPGQRPSSKTKRRESMSARPHPASCWECEQGRYHPPVGGDGRSMEMPYYVPPQAPVPDLPASSPKSARVPFHFIHDVQKSQGSHPQRRTNRSNSYHANNRPMSFHGMAPDLNMMYNMPPMSPFEHGPPLSASAFANNGSFTPIPFPQQHPQYYPDQQPAPQPIYERTRSLKSGTKDHPRRQSAYGPPVVEYPQALTPYDGGAAERRLAREHRARPPPKVEDGGALERLSSREHRARPPPPKTEDEDTMLERLPREHRIRPLPPPKSEDEDNMLERLSSREYRVRPPPKSEDEDNMLERLSSRDYRVRPPPKSEDEDNLLERLSSRDYRVRPPPKSEDEENMLERLSSRDYRVRLAPKSEDEDTTMLERLTREYRVRPPPKSEDEDMLERLTREHRVRPPKSEDDDIMLERISREYRLRQSLKSEDEDTALERLSRVRPSAKMEESQLLERLAALRIATSKPYDVDEDYYRMPPPPPPPPKQKPPPQVIQKSVDSSRKQVAPPANTDRRLSQTFDMSELEAVLHSNQALRKLSRDQIMPVRAHSVRTPRITAAYHETSRPGPMTVDDSHHHQPTYYEDESPPDTGSDFDQKQREAEEYQAAARGSKPVPLTADALLRAKVTRPDSDSGSLKSRSSSSHGSDIRTRDGSGVGSKFDGDNGFAMVVNGVTMNFPQELVGSKRICVRTGDQGEMELNIEGRRPKKYLMSRSDFTSSSGRNDLRRTLDDRRSDRASRHSSRSTYSSGFYERE